MGEYGPARSAATSRSYRRWTWLKWGMGGTTFVFFFLRSGPAVVAWLGTRGCGGPPLLRPDRPAAYLIVSGLMTRLLRGSCLMGTRSFCAS